MIQNGTVNLQDGVRFEVSDDSCEYIIDETWSKKVYDVSDRIKENFIIIDIGAHIGVFAVYAAKKAGRGKVYAYEPNPASFALLEKNVKINNLNNVIMSNLGVTKTRGDAVLFSNDTSILCSMYVKCGKPIPMKTTTLQDIFDVNNITECHFIKIDAEGAEYDILYPLPEKYFKKINFISLEYHNFFPKNQLKKLVKLLNNRGFRIAKLIPDIYSRNVGILCAERETRNKNQKFNNFLKYHSLGVVLLMLIISSKTKKIVLEINKYIGKIGIFLKKYYPRIYFAIKKIKK